MCLGVFVKMRVTREGERETQKIDLFCLHAWCLLHLLICAVRVISEMFWPVTS
jgi:hypothetical protein